MTNPTPQCLLDADADDWQLAVQCSQLVPMTGVTPVNARTILAINTILAAQAASVEPVGAYMTATVLATLLAEAVRKDEQDGGLDIGAGIFGHFTAELIREIAVTASAPPSPASVPGEVLERFEALWSGLSEENRKLVSDYVKHTMPAPSPSPARVPASLDAYSRHLDAQATPSPAQAVDAVDDDDGDIP